jgi:hypothetical protein
VSFDPRAFIRDLAAAHGLTAEPADTDHADLTRRALQCELDDIKCRMQALHDWSAAIIAEHEARPATHPDHDVGNGRASGPTTGRPNTRRGNRRRTRPRRQPPHRPTDQEIHDH